MSSNKQSKHHDNIPFLQNASDTTLAEVTGATETAAAATGTGTEAETQDGSSTFALQDNLALYAANTGGCLKKTTASEYVSAVEPGETLFFPEATAAQSHEQPEFASVPTSAEAPAAIVQVRLNPNPALGFCVYALRPFARGERLYKERYVLEATHDPDHRGIQNAHARYIHMSKERRAAMHGAFPELAWANDIDAYQAAEGLSLIGSRVMHHAQIDIQLTAEDHIRMRPDWSAYLCSDEGYEHHRYYEDRDRPKAKSKTKSKSKGTKTKATLSGFWRQPGKTMRKGIKGLLNEDEDDEDTFEADRKSHFSEKSRQSGISSILSGTTLQSSYSRDSSHDQRHHRQHHHHHSKPRFHNPTHAERDTLDWFRRYAFRLKAGSAFGGSGGTGSSRGHHQAAVYLLTDLINHRCHGQNCRVATEIGCVSVVAERDIAAGEELTINYHKDKNDFVCRAECCVPKKY